MKRTLIFVSLCLLQYAAVAQWAVGLRGGVSSTSITRSQAGRIDETYSSRCGFDLGVNCSYAVAPWLSVRADLAAMQRNHRLQRHLNYLAPVFTDHRNTYLLLPLMADFSFGGTRLRGHLLLGGYAGYWLSHRVKGTTYVMTDYDVFFNPFDEKRAFTSEDRRFNAGLLGGLALSYPLGGQIDLNLDAILYYDLVSHHKGYPQLQDYRYLNTASLTLGVTYRIPQTQQP